MPADYRTEVLDEMLSCIQSSNKRAQETGASKGYLQLYLEQAIAQLTLKTYQEFKKFCTKDEWVYYEETILKKLDKAWGCERLLIHMYRKEYDKAMTLLLQERYPYNTYGGEPYVDIVQTPEKWESFARKVKVDNKKRPAFQEEFGGVVPGWKTI